MKKKKIIVFVCIVCFILIGTLITVLAVLNNNSKEPDDNIPKIEVADTIMLESPRGITLTNNVLTWEKVENANQYIVCIDDFEYITTANLFDMSSVDVDECEVSVFCKGYDNYLSSIKSIKRHYIKNVDDDKIIEISSLIKSSLTNRFVFHMNSDFEKVIDDIAYECYLEGIKKEDVEKFTTKVLDIIAEFEQNKLENVDYLALLENLKPLFDNNLSNYANALMIKDFTIILIELYSNTNIFDSRFDKLSRELQKIQNTDCEVFAQGIRYLNSINGILQDQLIVFIEQLYDVFLNELNDKNNGIEVIYDFMTVKDQIVYNLYQEIPSVDDFNHTLDLFSAFYQTILPVSLEDNNLVDVFRYKFEEIYLTNHKIISYVDYFNADHFNDFTDSIVDLYNSVGNTSFEAKINEFYSYYENGMYELLAFEIIKMGFTTNGEYDFESYNKLRTGITKLLEDLSKEDYEYLEKALSKFFDGIFKYLNDEHHASILINPLIDYLKEGGEYFDHFVNQFNILDYVYLKEGVALEDVFNVIASWDKDDIDKIKNFKYTPSELEVLITDLGLDQVIVVRCVEFIETIDMNFIDHFVQFVEEVSLQENLIDTINLISAHYEFNEVIMPLINELLVNLDERYGLNIDYGTFIYNLLTGLGVDIPVTLLNIQNLMQKFEEFKSDFEYSYEGVELDVSNKNFELIGESIKLNLVYFIFGEEVVALVEVVDDLSYNIEFILQELESVIPKDLFDDLVKYLDKILNIDDLIIEDISALFNEEYILWIQEVFGNENIEEIFQKYLEDDAYKKKIDEMLSKISNDVILILDQYISYEYLLTDDVIKLLEMSKVYLDEHEIEIRNYIEKMIESYEKIKDSNLQYVFEFLENILNSLN